MNNKHKTLILPSGIECDVNVAPLVELLNTLPGVKTHYSCEGDPENLDEQYMGYVNFTCENDSVRLKLLEACVLTPLFEVSFDMCHNKLRFRVGWENGSKDIPEITKFFEDLKLN